MTELRAYYVITTIDGKPCWSGWYRSETEAMRDFMSHSGYYEREILRVRKVMNLADAERIEEAIWTGHFDEREIFS